LETPYPSLKLFLRYCRDANRPVLDVQQLAGCITSLGNHSFVWAYNSRDGIQDVVKLGLYGISIPAVVEGFSVPLRSPSQAAGALPGKQKKRGETTIPLREKTIVERVPSRLKISTGLPR